MVAANLDIFAEGSVMEPGAQGLYVMPGSQVRTLANLEGGTIGVNAPGNILYLLAAAALRVLPAAQDGRDAQGREDHGGGAARAVRQPGGAVDGRYPARRPGPGRDRCVPGAGLRRHPAVGRSAPADAGGVPHRVRTGPADREYEPVRRGAGHGGAPGAVRPDEGAGRGHGARFLSARRGRRDPAAAGGGRHAPVPWLPCFQRPPDDRLTAGAPVRADVRSDREAWWS